MTTTPDHEGDGPGDGSTSSREREADRERRRRLAAAFGDVVPEQTSDDVDPREDRTGKGDDWYREQVPPHHG